MNCKRSSIHEKICLYSLSEFSTSIPDVSEDSEDVSDSAGSETDGSESDISDHEPTWQSSSELNSVSEISGIISVC